jgi:4-hydroxybenzoate polyprenyltransferase
MPRSLGRQFLEFARTIRLSHTLFALPFALGTAMLAEPPCPDAAALVLLVACMATARTAAMGFNRVADAALDARNPRTADRPIPAGRLRRGTALALSLGSGAAFIGCAALFLPLRGNPWPAILAPAFLAVLIAYSWTKRWTVLTHWVLGLCLGLAPVGTWIALRGGLALLPVLVGAGVLFWTAGFDILYALPDVDFDRREGLRSIPARFGERGAYVAAALSHAVALALLAAAVFLDARSDQPVLSVVSLVALALIAVVLFLQHLDARPAEVRLRGFTWWNAAVSMLWLAGIVGDIALVPKVY